MVAPVPRKTWRLEQPSLSLSLYHQPTKHHKWFEENQREMEKRERRRGGENKRLRVCVREREKERERERERESRKED